MIRTVCMHGGREREEMSVLCASTDRSANDHVYKNPGMSVCELVLRINVM
jgi:hypothetical protein